jgi:hypothetical protein
VPYPFTGGSRFDEARALHCPSATASVYGLLSNGIGLIMLKKALFAAVSATALISFGSSALAASVSLSEGWKNQRLSLFSKNDYDFGQSLGIASDGAVSIAWRKLPRSFWEAERASWNWSVSQSVPATDLSVKGGDDRNISIYFCLLQMIRPKSWLALASDRCWEVMTCV